MKKVKILVASVLFCTMGYTGYTAHEKMAVSEAEKFMQVNVEALTLNEPGGSGSGPTMTCESRITTQAKRRTFYCGTCDWAENSMPTWDSSTTTCTK